MSEENRVRVKRLYPPRGFMYDRNYEVIADNRPSYNIYLVPENIYDEKSTLDWAEKKLGLNQDELKKTLMEHLKKNPPFTPLLIMRDVPFEKVLLVEAGRYIHPEFEIDVIPLRNYPCGEACFHFSGYVSEISPEEFKYFSQQGYRRGDYTGKAGLEFSMEKFLRGKEGARFVEIDATGREMRVLKEAPVSSGNYIVTTIDLRLQRFTYDLMKDKEGAVLLMSPGTGEILVWVSTPSFDPNLFLPSISQEEWDKLKNAENHPLLNRVIQGLYAPGSTFKVVTAIAGFLNNRISKNYSYFCKGTYRIGKRTFSDWKKLVHGRVDLVNAIKVSCDSFFYNLSLIVGPWEIFKVGAGLGLGQVSGIEIPGEAEGFIPNPDWKKKFLKEEWTPGETAIMGIGQGYTLVTPLQMVLLYSAIINYGVIPSPYIVKEIRDESGKIIFQRKKEILREFPLNDEIRRLIMEGLYRAVNEPGGTGTLARSSRIKIAGKTGTAQIVGLERTSMENSKHLLDHAWFIGFAPYDNPEVIGVVLVEHGGTGGRASAPILKAILEKYFEINLSENIP